MAPSCAFAGAPIVAAHADDESLGDIVVTARRRDEPLQRTPISVIALSARDLEDRSVTNLRTLQNFVPNLTFAPSQFVGEASTNIFIRGIGQEDYAASAESGVGFYVDGVYFARTTGTLMNLIDIDRVEILRGPQGTLFGKNTIGGAVNIISATPKLAREQSFSIILGSYSRAELRGVVNGPLSDKVLMRLSLGLIGRDGYLHRLRPPVPLAALERVNQASANLDSEGAERSEAVRFQLRWLPSERLTVDLAFDASHKRGTQGANHIDAIDPRFGSFPIYNQLIDQGSLPGPLITSDLATENLLTSYATGRNLIDQDLWGASAVVTRQLGAASIKLIAAYRGYRHLVATDADGLYFSVAESDLRVGQRQFSGEMQITGTAGLLAYTAGLFSFAEKATVLPTGFIFDQTLYSCGCIYPSDVLPFFTTERRRFTSNSDAAYAQGTFKLTAKLSATLGGRFTNERKSIDNQVFSLDGDLHPTDLLVMRGSNRESWNSFTYRGGLEFQATRDIMTYGSVAKGYKSGGFNSRSDLDLRNLGLVAYKPETALSYEAGLRSEWLGRKLRLNATLFTTKYTQIQLRQLTLVDGVETLLIDNAARARIRGVELELAAMPGRGLTVVAAYGHIQARYLDVGLVPNITVHSRFQRTPSDSLSASIDYDVPVRFGLLSLHGDYSYRAREQFQLAVAANDQPGYGLLAARLTLRSTNDRWALALFGTNLTNKLYRTAGRGTLVRLAGFAYSSIGLPRQVGVQLTWKLAR